MNHLLTSTFMLLMLAAGTVPATAGAAPRTAREPGGITVDAGPEGVIQGSVDCLSTSGSPAVLSAAGDAGSSPPAH